MSDHTPRPPVAARADVSTSLHGVTRTDSYSWMREVDSAPMTEYLHAERAYYDSAVRHTTPLSQALTDAIVARIPPTERSVTVERHRCVYYTERPTGRENGEIRRFTHRIETETSVWPPIGDELVLDIDAVRGGSPYVDLGLTELSPDESVLAYSVDLTGDEVYELRFRDLASGEDLVDVVPRSYYTGAWSAAGDQFFYTVHDDAYRPFAVRRHVLGTDHTSDVTVFTDDDEQYEVTVRSCRSGRLIVVTTANRDTTEEWLLDPAHPDQPPRCVEPRSKGREYAVEHAPYDVASGEVDRLVVLTNEGATEFRLMTAPTGAPGLSSWQPLGTSDSRERLEDVEAFAGFLVVTLRSGGSPHLRLLRHDGTLLRDLDPPLAGHIELAETPQWDATAVVVCRQSYVVPAIWSDVDARTGEERVRHRASAPGYDAASYAIGQVTTTARDGVSVPVTVVRRADVALDGTAPCLLYGYGAYEAVFEPEFDPALTVLLDHGVVFAFAHIRGGGEGGRRWWLDGRLSAKHHTFEDHIDVADSLAAGYVDGSRIVTRGLSAGGLLQAAVFSQRPDRWRGVVAEVPFVDVVTTMLDASIPLTANEWDEWGDPRREADFRWLLDYSPYDNLPQAGGRPDLLVTGAVHDARVMVWEPAKWVAALRHSDPDWSPRCLFRVDTGAGAHTGPSGRFAKARYEAEVYAWVISRLVP